jgi:hypothetical protein
MKPKGELFAGFARREITPPAGSPMAGFPDRKPVMKARIAEGAHDPLYVRALALRQGDEIAIICSADVLCIQWPDVDAIRNAFAQRTGVSPGNLILCATHTHSGPEVSYLFGGTPDDQSAKLLREKTVEAAEAALHNCGPAKLSLGVAEEDLSYNRLKIHPEGKAQWVSRNPERQKIGPADQKITALKLDAMDGSPVSSVVHFAAHPVILTNPNRKFSAEFPGAALSFLEKTGVGDTVYLQGAAGNLHPYQAITDSFDSVLEMGTQLGRVASTALQTATPVNSVNLEIRTINGELPHRLNSSMTVRMEIKILKISECLALVFWQGEPFVELSLALQWRSPVRHTIVVGYSNGWTGYVPHRRAYHYGGYGVDAYDLDPDEFSRTMASPGTGEWMIDETIRCLASINSKASSSGQ